MRTFLSSTQDASIYQRYPTNNTGLDEILEVGKTIKPLDGDVMYASSSARALIYFDVPSQQQYPAGAKYYLNLRIANASNIKRYQKLEVYPVSRSWIEGSGYFYQNVRNASDGITWTDASDTQYWATSGSDYITTPSSSYTFTKVPIEDIRLDVTNIIAPVVSGSNQFSWNGLLLKYPTVDELDSTNKGNIKVFSGNTHTVFAPTLEIAWVDQQFNTGSLKPIRGSNISIIPKNLKEAYTSGEIDKVYLVTRDLYPDKKYDAVQRYKNVYYLPSQSYFRITDQVSGVVLYNFDEYSTISCDVSGSYFVLDTSAFEINRYYNIDLKIKSDNLVFFPEFNYTFKVDANE
jgi:hypothetical protein